MTATMSVRGNFAIIHLRAAKQAALTAHEVETANSAAEFGAWFDDLMTLVPVAVVMASAALEASANELIQDVLDGSIKFAITDGQRQKVTALKSERTGNAITRYRQLSKILGKKPNRGNSYWQNASLLVMARNEFTHFRPAWFSDNDIDDRDLVTALKGRVPLSNSYRAPTVVFPYSFITYGFAKWAVGTVVNFSTEISKLMDVRDRFVGENLDFRLP